MAKIKTPSLHLVLCLLGGTAYALGFPSQLVPPQPLAPGLGVAALLYCLAPKGREYPLAIQCGLLLAFSLGFYGVGYRWLPFTISEFGQIPAPFNSLLGLCLAPAFIAPFWAYLGLRKGTLALIQRQGWQQPYLKTLALPLNATALTLSEVLCPQIFPTQIGHTWLPLAPYLGLTPLFGATIYSFVSYYTATSIAHRVFTPLFVLTLLVFLAANGMRPLALPPTDQSLNLRIVQPNIGNLIKMASHEGDPMALLSVAVDYHKLSTAPSERPIDLIIWPETAIAEILDTDGVHSDQEELPYFAQSVTLMMGAELVAGGYDSAQGPGPLYFEDQYNALFHIDHLGELQNTYHKTSLLPFGETIPAGPLKPLLFKLFPNVSFFAPGKKYPLFTLNSGLQFFPAICYEILFPSFAKRYLEELARRGHQRPHFIVNLTNDSWYGDTTEPHQHLFLAHWRAIELGLPIIRSTNTGITSILYPDGSESRRLGVGEKGSLDITLSVPTTTTPTPYQQFGLWPTLLVMALVNGLSLLLAKKPFV